MWIVPSKVVREEINRLSISKEEKESFLKKVMQWEDFSNVSTENNIGARSDILRRRENSTLDGLCSHRSNFSHIRGFTTCRS